MPTLDLLPKIETTLPVQRREGIIGRVMSRIEIDPDTGCWNWTGPTSGDGRGGGYGRMSLNGQTVATHIVVYTHFYGYVPGKKQIDHKCRNRLCCNPMHLEMVTHKQNQRRRAKAAKSLPQTAEIFAIK